MTTERQIGESALGKLDTESAHVHAMIMMKYGLRNERKAVIIDGRLWLLPQELHVFSLNLLWWYPWYLIAFFI